MLSTVKEKHSVSILCSPVRAALAPRTFKVQQCSTSSLDRVEGATLNYLDDWLILAQSLDTLISHIDLLLIHLEPLGLCVNMQRAFSPPPLARSRGDESPPLARSREDESPPLVRSSRGQFVFPAPFQARQLCSVEGFFKDCSDSRWRIQRYYIWDYYTCARCSYGWNLESRGRRGLRDVCATQPH